MKKTLIVLVILVLILSVYAVADELTSPRGIVIRKVSHLEWHGPDFAQSDTVYGLILEEKVGKYHTVYLSKAQYDEIEIGDFFR